MNSCESNSSRCNISKSICFDCQVLFCLESCCRCSQTASTLHENHKVHIGGGDSTIIDHIRSERDRVYNVIKLRSSIYQSLTQTENEISEAFGELHELLRLEEYKLRRPINNLKDTLEQQINQHFNQLKHLVNIINRNDDIINKNNNNSSSGDSYNYNQEEENNNISNYQITNIIDKINRSECLKSLIDDIGYHLLSEFSNEQFGNEEDQVESTDIDIMELVLKYYSSFVLNEELLASPSRNNTTFKLVVDKPSVNKVKQSIKQSFMLVTQRYRQQLQQEQQMAKLSLSQSNLQPKSEQQQYLQQQYILSITWDNKFATLIQLPCGGTTTTTTGGSTELTKQSIDLGFTFNFSYNSVVTVDDCIYIFGNDSHQLANRYFRFSIRSKSIDFVGEMTSGIKGSSISACFDGIDTVYLVHRNDNAIHKFTISKRQFERYHQDFNYRNNYYSFYYDSIIYFIPTQSNNNNNSIYLFDTKSKAITQHKDQLLNDDIKSACTDGDGNIYLYSSGSNRFQRFSTHTNQIEILCSAPFKFESNIYLSMVYHQASPTATTTTTQDHDDDDDDCHIYILGGTSNKKNKNFKYSILNNTWSQFFSEDDKDRDSCASSIVYMTNQK
ncbi:hypothetical protein PPL_11961 [Heterostelium album PN500]|uniref:B box-type domain-containing protein n=1 Tax=Heterostelium pallidum (strain ATCC 26659 / Pp 5 / PN500) TaxID=670386 RepID=D3BUY9_HETP5|nr:hypothetical protein PPL_11961 [Heterostelium album PN500]EFA74927.1 hypothetical protein PPL_11961 [Heterostelium album PN500]|eukprot:XP_020427061.1 hypothetical protein PPL_11961 [Heterostelium album PN500]